jgi:hypothetical protein
MKILIILCSDKMLLKYLPNIQILKTYMDDLETKGHSVDYAAISSGDDISNYESVISFKYKVINLKKQLSKVCDFLKGIRNSLQYDWYIKFRPEVILLDQIDFTILSDTAINARARQYTGPRSIKYGCSIVRDEFLENMNDIQYDPVEKLIILDDILYIFHKNVIENGGFIKNQYMDEIENEWFHTKHWMLKGIPLNIIGINMDFTGYKYGKSSHILPA